MAVSWDDDGVVDSTQDIGSTQEVNDEAPVEDDNNNNMSLTQHVTPQESLRLMYENDPQSVTHIGVIARILDENKAETLEPKHFFLSPGTVHMGSGHRTRKCDIAFPGAEKVGLSDCGLTLDYSQDPLSLKLSSSNRGNVNLRRSQGGSLVSISNGDKNVPIYQGDCIVVNSYGQHPGFDILFVNAPEDPARNAATDADAVTLCRKRALLDVNTRIASLELLREELKAATDEEAINHLMIPFQSDREATQTSTKKRPLSSDDSYQPKRQKADDQELRRFHQLKSQVLNAQRTLRNIPKRLSSKQSRQVQAARDTIAAARDTRCHFDKRGSCRDGSSCPFLHSSSAEDGSRPSSELRGILYKWNEHGRNGAFGFIRLECTGQELFCTMRSFPDAPKHLRASLPVLVGSIYQRDGRKQGQLDEARDVRLD